MPCIDEYSLVVGELGKVFDGCSRPKANRQFALFVYSIKNRQIQIGWKAGYVVQELRNRKGISTGRIVKEICEKPPTWIKEGRGSI
jgi:hypothetical protein